MIGAGCASSAGALASPRRCSGGRLQKVRALEGLGFTFRECQRLDYWSLGQTVYQSDFKFARDSKGVTPKRLGFV